MRRSCFSLHAEEFKLITTVSTWSYYLNLWHSEEKCNFRINGDVFVYTICWNRDSDVVTAVPGGQKFPPRKWWCWTDIAHFIRGIFPTGKKHIYFPVRQQSVSLLSIITANVKCTVVLAASGDGWLRVSVISRVIFRSPSNTMTVRKSLIRCFIQVWIWLLKKLYYLVRNYILMTEIAINLCSCRWRRRLERRFQSSTEGRKTSAGWCWGGVLVPPGPVQAQMVDLWWFWRWRWGLHSWRWWRWIQR